MTTFYRLACENYTAQVTSRVYTLSRNVERETFPGVKMENALPKTRCDVTCSPLLEFSSEKTVDTTVI